ncbi:MAG: hypothetical protein P8R54_15905 [Myxococcota bacterium]|nr:hypothetical protein [Myxococcota bacterium]
MKLLAEVMDMICRGRSLTARRVQARRGQPVQVSSNQSSIRRVIVNHQYAYEVAEVSPDGCEITSSYADLDQAVLEFAEQVGVIALREAVASNRYAWLFPTGSTLEWHASQAQRRVA